MNHSAAPMAMAIGAGIAIRLAKYGYRRWKTSRMKEEELREYERREADAQQSKRSAAKYLGVAMALVILVPWLVKLGVQ